MSRFAGLTWATFRAPQAIFGHVVDEPGRSLCGDPSAIRRPLEGMPRRKCKDCVFRLAFPAKFYVYVLHGDDRVLYVGCTNNLRRRLAEHNGRPYGADIVRTTVTGYDDVEAATTAELQAIKEHDPLHNSLPHAAYARREIHGSYPTYVNGCRCDRCRDAATAVNRAAHLRRLQRRAVSS